MNKYEVSEIKKNFRSECGFFTLNRIIVDIVNGDGEIKHTINKSGALLDSREEHMYYTILKTILSTKLGKNFIQYDFPKEALGKGHAQSVLYNALTTGFNSDAELNKFVQNIIDGYGNDAPFAIVAANCTYVVRRRDKLGIVKDVEDEEYNFIITALCPVISVDSGFSYNNQTGEFSTECDPKLYIQQKPTDGFLFPAFDDRSPNYGSVMYYCRKSSEADVAVVDNILECNFIRTADQDKEIFNHLLQSTFGEKANYIFMYQLNNLLCNIAEDHKSETNPYIISIGELYDVLNQLGAESKEIDVFGVLYQQFVGEHGFNLANLIESQIKLKTSEYTISFSKSVGDLVSTVVTDGAKSIKLMTSDDKIDINGTDVKI